jgi:hypothetical protein
VRGSRRRGPWGPVVGGILGLLIGTFVGRTWPVGPLAHPLALLPWQLDLLVVGIRVWVTTNVLGLVGAAAGVVLARIL